MYKLSMYQKKIERSPLSDCLVDRTRNSVDASAFIQVSDSGPLKKKKVSDSGQCSDCGILFVFNLRNSFFIYFQEKEYRFGARESLRSSTRSK